MDLDRYDKVKCSKIEQMLPKLIKMVGGDGCDGIATYENRKKNELRNI